MNIPRDEYLERKKDDMRAIFRGNAQKVPDDIKREFIELASELMIELDPVVYASFPADERGEAMGTLGLFLFVGYCMGTKDALKVARGRDDEQT